MPKTREVFIDESELNPSQQKFLESRAPYLLFLAGVGSGKSTALILKSIQLKIANENRPGLMMAETMGELMTNIVDPLMQICRDAMPRSHWPDVCTDAHGRRFIRWRDGCTVHLRSARAIDTYAGLNVAWLCGDEPWLWSRRNFNKAIERVRLRGPQSQRCFSSTPAMNFLHEEFNTGRLNRVTVQASTRENKHNLVDGYIEGLEQSYSPRMRKAMIDGGWTVLEGAVYEQLDTGLNSPWVVPFTDQDIAKSRIILAVDPGFRRSAWQWWAEQQTPKGHIWTCFDQLSPDGQSDFAAIEQVNARKWPIDEIWCDPAADNTQSLSGTDTIQALLGIKTREQAAVRIIKSPVFRHIPWGVDKARVLFGGYEGLPVRLRFAERLRAMEAGGTRGVMRDHISLRYPEAKDGKAVDDVPLKDGLTDHHTDATRYFVIGRFMSLPELREREHLLRKSTAPGYEVRR
jgi:hypothetical protein